MATNIENYRLQNGIRIFCLTARSFPEGILEVHDKLHGMVPLFDDRRFFGVSNPDENGTIIYKAGCEELFPGELDNLDLELVIIPSGNYSEIIIHNYKRDALAIRHAFQEILTLEGIDPNGFCVEWYLNETDVRCMVRMAE